MTDAGEQVQLRGEIDRVLWNPASVETKRAANFSKKLTALGMAGSTGLEPAASGLTVQCANQAAPRAQPS